MSRRDTVNRALLLTDETCIRLSSPHVDKITVHDEGVLVYYTSSLREADVFTLFPWSRVQHVRGTWSHR